MSDIFSAFQASVNPDEGQPQTVAPTGTEAQPEAKETEAPVIPAGQPGSQSKQDRHADRKITELSESRLKMARLAVEANPDNIVTIYQADKDVANKLFEEYDFKADSLEQLIHHKTNPDKPFEEAIRQKEQETKLAQVEEQLTQLKVEQLRTTNPDLKDEVEAEFKRLLNSSAFEDRSMTDILNIARLSVGKPVSTLDSATIKEVVGNQQQLNTNIVRQVSSTPKFDRNFLSGIFDEQDIQAAEKEF